METEHQRSGGLAAIVTRPGHVNNSTDSVTSGIGWDILYIITGSGNDNSGSYGKEQINFSYTVPKFFKVICNALCSITTHKPTTPKHTPNNKYIPKTQIHMHQAIFTYNCVRVAAFVVAVSGTNQVVSVNRNGRRFRPPMPRSHGDKWAPSDCRFSSVLDSENGTTMLTVGRRILISHFGADGCAKTICGAFSGKQSCQVLEVVRHLVSSIIAIRPLAWVDTTITGWTVAIKPSIVVVVCAKFCNTENRNLRVGVISGCKTGKNFRGRFQFGVD